MNRRHRHRVAVVGRKHVRKRGVPHPTRRDVAEDEFVSERRHQLAAVNEPVGDGIATFRRGVSVLNYGYVGLTVPRETVSEI